jgi:hypothetical protein
VGAWIRFACCLHVEGGEINMAAVRTITTTRPRIEYTPGTQRGPALGRWVLASSIAVAATLAAIVIGVS